MKQGRLINRAFVLSLFLLLLSCSNMERDQQSISEVNINHLKHLYANIDLPGNVNGGIIRIYSEYPDYNFEIEPNEGFTCVDDVARAMMLDAYRFSEDKEIQFSYNSMAEFLIYMQAENGFFHNFIWHDLSINKTYRTSIAEPNWWSWRAFWALSNYNGSNQEIAIKAKQACERLMENIYSLYLEQPLITDTINGIEVPAWLPLGTAGDQAAILILGLEAYYINVNQDERVLQVVERMADGLQQTQKGEAKLFPYGAFLSWQNIWHAYGNGQAYAMLRAGQLLNRNDYIECALLEIDHFYPYLIKENFPASFIIQKADNGYEIIDLQQYSQIAYGFRPMIWACVEAFNFTGEQKHLLLAEEIVQWFSGKNIAGKQMYDSKTGRCFDGIVSKSKINKNSGAESTIEALLSLQVFDQSK